MDFANQQNPSLKPFEKLSDAEVVMRILAGDTPLFELLMRRYNARLFRLARSVVINDANAEDVVQDAYIVAYQKLAQFRGPAGFGAWLSKITFRAALASLERERRPTTAVEVIDQELRTDDQHQPELVAQESESVTRIRQAIDHLPPDFRSVFSLRELENLSTGETAEILDIKPTTVKTRLFRAKIILRRRLGSHFKSIDEEAYPFGGSHCDALVARVFQTLNITVLES